MSPSASHEQPDPNEKIDRLAEEFLSSWREGGEPSVAEYAARHPEIADDIRTLFPVLTTMEDLKLGVAPPGEPADTQLGDYRLVREIGRGGMGVVYEAIQETLGRRVALKILPIEATRDPRYLERFRTEAQAAGRLQHPNIVPVIGYGEHDGIHYYTMQFVEGHGLDELLREGLDEELGTGAGRGRYERAARIIHAAAEGVAAAHAHGVLHRDIKPSNLMLDEQDKVWITDFGLCKEVGSDDMTRSGDLLGTLRYMPPERLTGESDVQGDVYGLGVTLYEMLTLKPAYGAGDRVALLARLANEDPLRPRAMDRGIPADLEAIVLKAIARDRRRRYATADALASDLRAFLDGRPITARAPTFGYYLRTSIRRHRALAITVGLAVLALLASSVFYVRSLQRKEADARFQNYVANIAAAEAALQNHSADIARRMLDAAPAEFRNWEWHHLRARLDLSLRTIVAEVPTYGVSWSPDGAWLAVGAEDETRIYRDEDGAEHTRLTHDAGVRILRWSPTGALLAVATHAGLEIWNWPGCVRLHAFDAVGAQNHVGFSADGRVVATGGVDGMLRLFDTASGDLVVGIQVHSRIWSLDVHPDGDRVVTGTWDGRVALWDLSKGTCLWWKQASRTGLKGVCFVGRDLIATPSGQPHTHIWSVADGALVRTLAYKYQSDAATVFSSPDGRTLIVAARSSAHRWDTSTWEHVERLDVNDRTDDVAFHPQGTRCAVVSPSGRISEWSLASGDTQTLTGHLDGIGAVAYAPSGDFFVTGGFGCEVRVWDARTREQTRTWIGHKWTLARLAVSPDSRLVAGADASGEVVIWDATTDEVRHRLAGHERTVWSVAFLPDGRHLVSAGEDGDVCLWDVETGALTARVNTPGDAHYGLAVHPNGRWIVTGGAGGRLHIHDAATLAVERELTGHEGKINAMAFHRDGKLLASVSGDQTMKLWDFAKGRPMRTFRAQTGASRDFAMLDLAFSVDGSRIATSAIDGTVRLWDTDSGRLVATLGGHDAWVHEVAFSPDGHELVSVSGHAEVRVWDTRPTGRRFVPSARTHEVRALVRNYVEQRTGEGRTPDAIIAELKNSTDLDPTFREAALREAHRRRGSLEALVDRLWRDVTPREFEPLQRWIARGLAADLLRVAGSTRRQDSRSNTLWGALTCRLGDYELAIERLESGRMLNEARYPALLAVDLAFLTMAHAGLGHTEEAEHVLGELQDLMRATPAIVEPRLEGFFAEAREAVARSQTAASASAAAPGR